MSDELVSNDTLAKIIIDSVESIGKWIKDHTKSNGSIKSKPFENGTKELQTYLNTIEKNTAALQTKLEDAQETIVNDILTISSMENNLNDARNIIQQMKENQETLMNNVQTNSLLDKTGAVIAIDDTMTEDGYITHVVKAIGHDVYFDDTGVWHNAADTEHASNNMADLVAQLPKIIAEMQQENSAEAMPQLIAKLISVSNQLQRLSDEEVNTNGRESV